uniref:Uncharacterized protein n=1 Tax=Dicentrarchus labrax TaxID=13489 RepID=A0A8C4ISC6_DICLA
MCNTARFRYDGVIDSPLWCSEVITSPVMIHVFSNCSDIIHVGYTHLRSLAYTHTRTHSHAHKRGSTHSQAQLCGVVCLVYYVYIFGEE